MKEIFNIFELSEEEQVEFILHAKDNIAIYFDVIRKMSPINRVKVIGELRKNQRITTKNMYYLSKDLSDSDKISILEIIKDSELEVDIGVIEKIIQNMNGINRFNAIKLVISSFSQDMLNITTPLTIGLTDEELLQLLDIVADKNGNILNIITEMGSEARVKSLNKYGNRIDDANKERLIRGLNVKNSPQELRKAIEEDISTIVYMNDDEKIEFVKKNAIDLTEAAIINYMRGMSDEKKLELTQVAIAEGRNAKEFVLGMFFLHDKDNCLEFIEKNAEALTENNIEALAEGMSDESKLRVMEIMMAKGQDITKTEIFDKLNKNENVLKFLNLYAENVKKGQLNYRFKVERIKNIAIRFYQEQTQEMAEIMKEVLSENEIDNIINSNREIYVDGEFKGIRSEHLFEEDVVGDINKDSTLKNEEEILKDIEKGMSIDNVSKEFFEKKSFCLELVKIDGGNLKYINPEIEGYKDVVMEALKYGPSIVRYIEGDILGDKEFILEASKKFPYMLPRIQSHIWKDKEFVLKLIENNSATLEHIRSSVWEDKEFVMKVSEEFPPVFGHITDKEFLFEVLENNPDKLPYINRRMMEDKEFILEASKKFPEVLFHIKDYMREDKEFMFEVLENNPDTLEYMKCKILADILNSKKRDMLEDKEFMLGLAQKNSGTLEYIKSEILEDKEFILQVLREKLSYIVSRSAISLNDISACVSHLSEEDKSYVVDGLTSIVDEQDLESICKYIGVPMPEFINYDEEFKEIENDLDAYEIKKEEIIIDKDTELKAQESSKETPKKKREDSRSKGIKISQQLSEKLGKSNTDGINILVNFERQQKALLEISNCSDEMRAAISEKMVGLAELLAKVYKITKSHVSNDKKKEQLENLIDNMDVIGFVAKLGEEISQTKPQLVEMAKNAAKNITEEIKNESEIVEQGGDENNGENSELERNLEVEIQEVDKFDASKDTPSFKKGNRDYKKSPSVEVDEEYGPDYDWFEVDSDKEMIEYKKPSLFERIKNIFSKKFNRSTNKTKDDRACETVRNEPEQALGISDETRKSKNIKKQKLFGIGTRLMEGINKTLINSTSEKSEEEITPNIIEDVLNRVATFSQDKKIGDLCKGIAKDLWGFANEITYNVGDYVVKGASRGIKNIRESKDNNEMQL